MFQLNRVAVVANSQGHELVTGIPSVDSWGGGSLGQDIGHKPVSEEKSKVLANSSHAPRVRMRLCGARCRCVALPMRSDEECESDSALEFKGVGSELERVLIDRLLDLNEQKAYTDDSRDDYYRSGSGIYIKSQDHNLRIQRKNPDGCSAFCSELIAIEEALGSLASLPDGKEI
ncbi:uncharacterized protein TNCV_3684991 [Trichonephila clavipes]|uniref:Uncharacterized protein n=1 Tax=Trichonephila clavipes TaxID=2585209 RepID=A0A8X6V583_TRICX|nr:uncharacterized protein TNCV_3684991 [Trichonephila clavipes]